jgi:PBP1b-binding outer membrane lipoprotein LpoB
MTVGSSSFIFEHNTVKNIEADNSQSVNGTFLRLSENYNILTISENRFENISGKGAGGAISFELTKKIVIESCMFI